MTQKPLTDFEYEILLLAHDGLSNRQIAAEAEKPFACIITTLANIKRKGHRLPTHRPLDATAEIARGREQRRGGKTYASAPRFTAKGVKASTGERFDVTSDSQAFADDHLAALVRER